MTPTEADAALGTIGGGNHCAELQLIEKVVDAEALDELHFDPDRLCLLVHSGSLGYGEAILRHMDRFGSNGVEAGSPGAHNYLTRHDNAVSWAKANRALIAHRFSSQIGSDVTLRLDACHNAIVEKTWNGASSWVHVGCHADNALRRSRCV